MEKFSSNLVLYCSYTPNRKYENNEQELMGEERKTLKSSLFPLRALFERGNDGPVLPAAELGVPRACCCAEPSLDTMGQLSPALPNLALPQWPKFWSSC